MSLLEFKDNDFNKENELLIIPRDAGIKLARNFTQDEKIEKVIISEVSILFFIVQEDYQIRFNMTDNLENNSVIIKSLFVYSLKNAFNIPIEQADNIYTERISDYKKWKNEFGGINDGFYRRGAVYLSGIIAEMISSKKPVSKLTGGLTANNAIEAFTIFTNFNDILKEFTPLFADALLKSVIKNEDEQIENIKKQEFERRTQTDLKKYFENSYKTMNNPDINTDITKEDEKPINTDITEDDLWHELYREADQCIDAEEEYKRRKAAEDEKIRQEAIIKQQKKQATGNPMLKPSIFFFPIMLAVAAMLPMPSGYYTFWKLVVLFEAIILISIKLNEPKFRSEKVTVATVFMVIMAAMGFISFMNGGFDRTFWIIMDIAYCVMHTVLYLGLLEAQESQAQSKR